MIPCDQAVFLPIFLLALQLLKRHGHDTNPVFQIGPQLNLLTQPDKPRGEVAVLDVSCPLLHPVPHGFHPDLGCLLVQ